MKDTNKVLLDNGIVLIHRYTEPLPIVSVRCFIKAGAREEPEDKTGISNLALSLHYKGTGNRTAEQIAADIESVGGNISGDATEDYSEISVSITSEHFERAVEVMADMLLNPTFPEDELEKERRSMLAGIRSRQDRIFNVAMDLMMKNLYGSHPYGRPPMGTEETVRSITREDIVSWHDRYFGVPNIVMVVTGKVKLKEARKLVSRHFEGIPSGREPLSVHGQPELKERKKVTEKRKFKQAFLMHSYLVPQVKSDDYPKLKLLNDYLGRGMSSLLFQSLREDAGLGYAVSCFYPSRMDTSRFAIYIGLDRSSLDEAEKRILEIIDKLRTEPVDEKRLQEVKDHVKGTFLMEHQTVNRQGWYLGWWELLGKGYEYDDRYVSDLLEVTPGDIMEMANKYFRDEYVLVQVVPAE